MHNSTLGLIFSENPEANLGDLTNLRALAAVPVGGRYRIIDFILSNMVNTGIANVGITTTSKMQSLTDHLGTGKDWDLARKQNGLFILPHNEAYDSNEQYGVDYIYNAFSYLRRSRQDYVLVSDCNTICNLTYEDVEKLHMEKDADITMVYTKVGQIEDRRLKRHIFLDVDKDGRVTDMELYPTVQKLNNSYMHMFYIKKSLLLELVGDCIAHGKHKLNADLLMSNIDKLKIYAYEFEGYSKTIDNIKTYFGFNLDLLKKEVRDELFGKHDDDRIYTKVKDMVPTKYGKNSCVTNSIIADGCVIEGQVKNCIIFRGVKIGEGAVVENSIIMQNSQIMENCLVENAIFDKEVILREGKKLVGQETYPVIIGKRVVV